MFLIPVMFIWRKCRTGSDWFDANVVVFHWRERFLKRLNPQPFRLFSRDFGEGAEAVV